MPVRFSLPDMSRILLKETREMPATSPVAQEHRFRYVMRLNRGRAKPSRQIALQTKNPLPIFSFFRYDSSHENPS